MTSFLTVLLSAGDGWLMPAGHTCSFDAAI